MGGAERHPPGATGFRRWVERSDTHPTTAEIGRGTRYRTWFAKDVGVVKQYIKMPTAEITSELKKFDPGK